MSLKVFLELVEFKAKTASVLPFFIGLAYSYYHYHTLHIGLVFIYFVAMFLFNMAVDILEIIMTITTPPMFMIISTKQIL